MPTKYILHGGFNKARGPVQENDEFFREMLKIDQESLKVLLVYFAEREEMVDLRIEQDKEQFSKNKGTKEIEFKVATEELFLADCQWADVIYLHGGKSAKLMPILNKFSDLDQAIKGKVIAGDSAGAKVLGQQFYSNSTGEFSEGLGILPYKIVTHYSDGASNPLADKLPGVETIFLREYEMKIIEQ